MITERKQSEILTPKEPFPGYQEVKRVFSDMEANATAIALIGHKGDHLTNLRELGLLERELDIMSVHNDFGTEHPTHNYPPEHGSSSYEDYFAECNPDAAEKVVECSQYGDVYVFMPFPNLQFEETVRMSRYPQRVHTLIHSGKQLTAVENKGNFSTMLGRFPPQYQTPYTYINHQHTSFTELQERLGSRGIVLQKLTSAGGDGTKFASDVEGYQTALDELRNGHNAEEVLKAAAFIDGYDSNISLVVTHSGRVLVDTPSRKVVGLPELGSKGSSGNGHDWHYTFPDEMLENYLQLAVGIGRELWREYGYTGLAGLESIVTLSGDTFSIKPHEINPRTQGTTPYITANAVRNGRLPLEIAHYLVHLAPKVLDELVPNEEEYNRSAISEKGGCFYLKCGNPTSSEVVITDNMTGAYRIENDELLPIEGVSLFDVLRSDNPGDVFIKGPQQGIIVRDSLAPFGYICGHGFPVFNKISPGLTREGTDLAKLVYNRFIKPN